jgi:hypothetical protein
MWKKSLIVAVVVTIAVAGLTVPANAAQQPSTAAPSVSCVEQLTKARMAGQAIGTCSFTAPGTPTKVQTERAKNTLAQQATAARRKPTISPSAAGSRPNAARTTAIGTRSVLDRCTRQASDTWTIDRGETCRMTNLKVIYRQTGPPFNEIGQMVFLVVFYAYTLSGPAWAFNLNIQKTMERGNTLGSFMTGSFNCSGACSIFIADPINTSVDGPGAEVHVGAIYQTGIFDDGQVGFATSMVTLDINKPLIGNGSGPVTAAVPRVRCDSLFSNRGWGCVFPDSGPQRYFLNSGFFPDVAEHVAASQASGVPGHDIPLTRQMNTDANREVACPDSRPKPQGMSCDEYPFASTKEGAASAPDNGETFWWCQIGDLPVVPDKPARWSACMVDAGENFDAGNDLGEFYADWRVISGDTFFVEIA